jgi:hypothetical protein
MTWTNIPDTNIEPGKPVRSIDMIAMRDNIPALANGDAGAPRIKTAAIDAGQVTNDKLQPPVAGDLYLIARLLPDLDMIPFGGSGEGTIYSNETIVNGKGFDGYGFCVLVAGTIRVRFDHRGFSLCRLLKNGAIIATYDINNGNFISRSIDVTVGVGDNITLQANYGTNFHFVKNYRVLSNNPNFAVA